MSIVLITGATSGFGRAIAMKFAEHGWNVIATGRRKDRLENLEKEITSTFETKVFTLPFDVRNQKEVHHAINALPHDWKIIDVLVNNAGLASGLSPIHEGEISDWEVMIDTNIKGLLFVSNEIMPGMVERKKGHIVNIGSIAGKEAYAKGNVYCATKHAVDALSKSMRIDLLLHSGSSKQSLCYLPLGAAGMLCHKLYNSTANGQRATWADRAIKSVAARAVGFDSGWRRRNQGDPPLVPRQLVILDQGRL